LNGTEQFTRPKGSEIELTLFGPGFGECCLVHVGSGRWIVVDSCIEPNSNLPAAFWYLEKLGYDPSKVVDLIVASHWHDDHIRGLARIVEICSEARFCCSTALRADEFRASVLAYSEREIQCLHPGPQEIIKIYEHLNRRRGQTSKPIRAVPNRKVHQLSGKDLNHGQNCAVWTLSPSDEQIERFLLEIASLMPVAGQTKRRIVKQDQNQASVVVLVTVGPLAVLLGGDLEEEGDGTRGWQAIVSSAERENTPVSGFKVPHHGSINAHSDSVWSEMLSESPHAVLTPYNRGATKLPRQADCARINNLTPNAWCTASPRIRSPRKSRPRAVEKTIREVSHRFKMADPEFGWVRIRWQDPQSETPTVTLSKSARTLKKLQVELADV